MGNGESSDKQHRTEDRALLAPEQAPGPNTVAPGRMVRVAPAPLTAAGHCATALRSARGALAQLRTTWIPALEAAARERRTLSPIDVIDARAALTRAAHAISQASSVPADSIPAAVGEQRDRASVEHAELGPQVLALLAAHDAVATASGGGIGMTTSTAVHCTERRLFQCGSLPSPPGGDSQRWATDVAAIAPRLGLGAVEVRSDEASRAITELHGARGVALGTTVHLHPDRVQPGTSEGREVLAHELVHLAQAQLPSAHDAGRDAAEHEAAELARAIVDGGVVRRPVHAIDLSRAAADHDAGSDAPSKAPSGMINAPLYLTTNSREVLEAIGNELLDMILPEHPRLTWANGYLFRFGLGGWLGKWLDAGDELPGRLLDVVFPAPLTRLVDGSRSIAGLGPDGPTHRGLAVRGGALGPMVWQPAVGRVIADAVSAAIAESIIRMAPRYLACADDPATTRGDGGRALVRHDLLVTSHAMDPLVARAMCNEGVLDVAPAARGQRAPAPAAVRTVDLAWQGAGDSALWNVVKVTPADATAEEAAAAIWADESGPLPGERSTFHAQWLTGAAPYFAIHPGKAIALPLPRSYRQSTAPVLDLEEVDTDSMSTLASSPVGDAAALAQAADVKLVPGKGHTAIELARTALATSAKQIDFIIAALDPWGLAAPVARALLFVGSAREMFATATAGDAQAWAKVAVGQQQNLFEISGGIAAITSEIAGADIDPTGPVAPILADYARAAGAAHLVDAARGMIAAARRRQGLLAGELAASAGRASAAGVDDMRDATEASDQAAAGRTADAPEDFSREVLRLDRDRWTRDQAAIDTEARAIRSETLAGQVVDPTRVEEVMLRADELSLATRVRALQLRVRELERAVDIARKGWTSEVITAFDKALPAVATVVDALQYGAQVVEQELDIEWARAGLDPTMPPAEYAAAVRQLRHTAVSQARAAFDAIGKPQEIAWFLQVGYQIVADHQFRVAVLQVALMIGVAIFTAGVGEVAGGAVEAVLGDSTLARGVAVVADLGTEALGNTIANAAITGGPISGWDVVENFLANAATGAILRGFSAGARVAEEVEQAAWSIGRRGVGVLGKAVQVTAEGIVGIATGYVSHRAVLAMRGKTEPPSEKTLRDWLLEGAAIGVGRFVHGQVAGMKARLGGLRGLHDEGLAALEHEGRSIERAAAELEAHPDEARAQELLARRQALADGELALLRRLEAVEGTVMSNRAAAARAAAEHEATTNAGPELAGVAFALGGFREVVPGTVFEGSADHVRRLVGDAEAFGLEVVAHDPAARRWTIRHGDRSIQLDEVGPAAEVAPIPKRKTTRPPSAAEVTANKQRAAIARAGLRDHSGQLAKLVEAETVDGHLMTKVGRIVLGTGPAAAMTSNTLPGERAALPERLTEIPGTIAIGTGVDTFTKLGDNPIGQRAPELDGPGWETSPGRFTTNHGAYASATTVADATAVTQYASGVPVLDAMILEVSVAPDATWKVAGAKVRIKLKTPTGERYIYADATDIATGLGPHKQLDLTQINAADPAKAASYKARLEASGRMVYGDEPRGQRGGKVLVSGGSATGAWNAELARKLGGTVDWIARPSAAVPTSQAASAEYARNKAQLESGTLGAEQAQALVARQAELSAFDPARLPRNLEPDDAAFNGDGVTRSIGEIKSLTPTEDIVGAEPGKVQVELSTGAVAIYDQVVISHGPALDSPAKPGPAGALTLANGIEMRPVVVAGQVVALESVDPPGAVRVMGAAMWSGGWRARIKDPDAFAIYSDALQNQARSAPRDSPLIPLLHSVAKQIPAANGR